MEGVLAIKFPIVVMGKDVKLNSIFDMPFAKVKYFGCVLREDTAQELVELIQNEIEEIEPGVIVHNGAYAQPMRSTHCNPIVVCEPDGRWALWATRIMPDDIYHK